MACTSPGAAPHRRYGGGASSPARLGQRRRGPSAQRSGARVSPDIGMVGEEREVLEFVRISVEIVELRRIGRCRSARGPDADRRHKLSIPIGTNGSKLAPNNTQGARDGPLGRQQLPERPRRRDVGHGSRRACRPFAGRGADRRGKRSVHFPLAGRSDVGRSGLFDRRGGVAAAGSLGLKPVCRSACSVVLRSSKSPAPRSAHASPAKIRLGDLGTELASGALPQIHLDGARNRQQGLVGPVATDEHDARGHRFDGHGDRYRAQIEEIGEARIAKH